MIGSARRPEQAGDGRPEAAIIVPHYRDPVRLKRCLAALAPQIGPGIEAVVVDNASPERPEVPPPFRLVIEPLKGAANARNRGVAETSAERLLFIDSDCLPSDDWVATALRVADRADIVGGHVGVFDETPRPRSGAEAFESVFAFDFRRYIEEQGFSGTGNLVTRRDVFDRVGGFWHGVSEDLNWCRRATSAGFSLAYAPELRVGHPSRQDWPALREKWRRLSREIFGVNGNGIRDRARWALRALAMPASILAHTPRILRAEMLDRREKLRALATLARIRLLRMLWMLRQAVGKEI